MSHDRPTGHVASPDPLIIYNRRELTHAIHSADNASYDSDVHSQEMAFMLKSGQ